MENLLCICLDTRFNRRSYNKTSDIQKHMFSAHTRTLLWLIKYFPVQYYCAVNLDRSVLAIKGRQSGRQPVCKFQGPSSSSTKTRISSRPRNVPWLWETTLITLKQYTHTLTTWILNEVCGIHSFIQDGFFLQPPTERTLWAANLRPRAGCTLSVSLSLCLMFYRFIFWTLLFSFLPTRSYSSKAFVIKHPATTLRCQIHRLFLNCNLY